MTTVIRALPLTLLPSTGWLAAMLRMPEACVSTAFTHQAVPHPNRYRIATANGALALSVPLQGGRKWKGPMRDVAISYAEDWQRQHWRTLFSAYGRAPYWEHFSRELEALYAQKHILLREFSRSCLEWICTSLRCALPAHSDAASVLFFETAASPVYTQTFAERHGFLKDLSVLDLLMNEGPFAAAFFV